MKTIERTDHFTGLNRIVHNHSEKLYKWHLHSYDNDTYGYSCSFPQVWNVDTTSNCSWTAHFLGGKMEISTHLHTNRTNVTHYITSLVS